MNLDVIVGKALLAGQSVKSRSKAQTHHHCGGDIDICGGVADAKQTKLDAVMVVETIGQPEINGDIPHESCYTVKDSSQTALLSCQTGQLTVHTVKQCCPHQQQDGDDVVNQTCCSLVIETAVSKEDTAATTDNHRQDGNGIGMYVQTVKQAYPQITQGAHDVHVEPVFCLSRF